MNDQFKRLLQDLLAGHGWCALDSTAIAFKDFATAVGCKRALVFCYRASRPDCVWLVGEYWSEGQDVLASRCAVIPTTRSTTALSGLIARFVADADAAVQASYAARLLRAFP